MTTASELIPGKIFIGGIAPTSTRDSIKKYFSKYGEIVDSVLMQDRLTGKSRGFGFVTFKNPSLIKKVLADNHSIDGKKVECKQALPADQRNESQQEEQTNQTTKIFVGGISQGTTEANFKRFFEQFGKTEEAFIMVDKATSKSRGFGFVTFTTVGAVERVIDNYDDNFIDGKWVECKKAFPKDLNNLTSSNYSSPARPKLNSSTKKYSEKIEPSSEDKKSKSPEKRRDSSSEDKYSNEKSISGSPSRKQSESESISKQNTKSLDKSVDCSFQPELQTPVKDSQPVGMDSDTNWQGILESELRSNKEAHQHYQMSFAKQGRDSDSEAEGNDYETEDNSQQLINTNFFFNQIDDSNSPTDPLSRRLRFSSHETVPDENMKAKRICHLFGVDLYDIQNSEAMLQGTNLNSSMNYDGQCFRHFFFPAARKISESSFDSNNMFFQSHGHAYSGHEEARLLKNLDCIWDQEDSFDFRQPNVRTAYPFN